MQSFATDLVCLHGGARSGLEPLFDGCPACAREGFLAGHAVTYKDTDAPSRWLGPVQAMEPTWEALERVLGPA